MPRRLHLLVLAAAVAVGCKNKKDGETCVPEDQEFKVNVLVQPTDQLNPDDEGTPLSVVFRLYQVKGDTKFDSLDFKQVWQGGGEAAFEDDFAAEEELTIYPGKPESLEVKPEADVTHFVAVAIFREPLGQDWFRVWAMPKYHGDSVCLAQRQKKVLPDPCFYVLLDQYQVDGGHTAPTGFDEKKAGIACPGPPLKVPPPPPDDGKKKKKKKRKKLKDAKAPEAPEAPKGPEAPEKPAAPEKPGG